ncbi:MAG: ABC transporter ATP-binding protein [Lachnospiraceae bacterium]|nr:ABC transporter ATP-binding protein [Lachnospiraceae bacterium]
MKNVSLEIPNGQFLSVVGRSGSGKTTLLKMLGGLLRPTEGEVLIDGEDLYEMSDRAMADYRSNRIGFVFQEYLLEEAFTVEQNIEIALMIAGTAEKERRELITNALEQVGMEHKRTTKVGVLSGGEKQRVSIARAIVNHPSVIFADEPCGNLDYENGVNIMKLLREQCRQGRTVVLITHNRDDALVTDRIVTLKDGAVVRDEMLG